MAARENVVEQQCHPNMCEGGHVGAHDLHRSPRYVAGKVLRLGSSSG